MNYLVCWKVMCDGEKSDLLVRVLQRNRANRMYIKTYYKELTHLIMKAVKSRDWQSASWRHRKATGVFPVWKQTGSRPMKSQCFSSSLKAGKADAPAWRWSGRRHFFSLKKGSAFAPIQAFSWLDESPPHQGRDSALLSSLTQMFI